MVDKERESNCHFIDNFHPIWHLCIAKVVNISPHGVVSIDHDEWTDFKETQKDEERELLAPAYSTTFAEQNEE